MLFHCVAVATTDDDDDDERNKTGLVCVRFYLTWLWHATIETATQIKMGIQFAREIHLTPSIFRLFSYFPFILRVIFMLAEILKFEMRHMRNNTFHYNWTLFVVCNAGQANTQMRKSYNVKFHVQMSIFCFWIFNESFAEAEVFRCHN